MGGWADLPPRAGSAAAVWADAPGRGEPGSGELPLDDWLAAIAAGGYAGYVAAEYKPTVTSANSFGWLPADVRVPR